MPRYIDADTLLADMMSVCSPTQFGRSTAKMCIKRAPTADVAAVVRCKDCIHYTELISGVTGDHMCNVMFQYVRPDCYCSEGEKRYEIG